ncbi:MAG: glycoside hydrolase family 127 protein [Actinobacteria bacterium]|nr:glycoside hydrolase family 127 protein [Actinomycetota bacterium]
MYQRELKPDTLVLQECAALGMNNLIKNLDKKKGYMPFFWTILNLDPPEARHGILTFDFGDTTGRYLEALLLAIQMTGNQEGAEESIKLKELLLSFIDDEDHLSYSPKTSWCEHAASIHNQRGTIMALTNWFWLEGDDFVKQKIDQMIKALSQIAVYEDDFCYFPYGLNYSKDLGWHRERGINDGLSRGALINPLLNHFQVTSNNSALQLAKGLVNYVVKHSPDFSETGNFMGHSESMMSTVVGVLRYGIITNQDNFIHWAKRVYDWTKTIGSSTGWFPEFVGRDINKEGCETCTIVNLMECALNLARSGYPAYLNDVERYLRNHLIESQLVDLEWIERIKNAKTVYPSDIIGDGELITDIEGRDTENILERVKGGFAGWSALNDWIGHNPYYKYLMMNCCSPSGIRALFFVWHNTVTMTSQGIFVNFNLNRDTNWVEVNSYHPFEGKVEIRIHDAPTLFVRIPEWVMPGSVNIYVNSKITESIWDRRYVKITNLKKDDVVIVEYPVNSAEKKEIIGGREFWLKWRGDTVIDIKPAGEIKPLYQRKWILQEKKTPLKVKSYFKPSKEFPW